MATNSKKPAQPAANPNTPGIIILQWLTYAFWGWLILGLMWLMITVLINAIMGESTNEMVPYAVAATIVLLPIAFTCDLFYRKYEPTKKTGVATIIMVVHAVLFALIGIGTLVASVFIATNALINSGEVSGGQMVALLSTLFATLLYAAAFLRTLNPFKGKGPSRAYGTGMLGLSILLLILAIAGPLVASVGARTDRQIEENLPTVQDSINQYISENDALPASLGDVTYYDEDAEALVDDGLVAYTALGEADRRPVDVLRDETTYRYELCVEYKLQRNMDGRSSLYTPEEYSLYVNTYRHDSGEVCYKLQYTDEAGSVDKDGSF